MQAFFNNMFDRKVFSNKAFSLYCFGRILSDFMMLTPYIHIPYMMLSHGISLNEGSIAMSVLAASNGIGRILSGLATNFPQHTLAIQGLSRAGAAICFFVLPNCVTSLHFFIMTGIYGLAIAPLTVVKTTVMVNIVGMNLLTSAYGISETIYGFGVCAGPTIIATILLYFSTYHIPFYLGGLCFTLAVALDWVTLKFFSKGTDDEK